MISLDNVRGFNASARNALLIHMWLGNVRELKQKIQAVVLHTESDMITDADLEFCYESVSSSTVSFALPNNRGRKETNHTDIKIGKCQQDTCCQTSWL